MIFCAFIQPSPNTMWAEVHKKIHCLNGRVLGGLKTAETAHHYIMECDDYARIRSHILTLFTGRGTYTMCQLYVKNDPDLIAKFLLCCRDKRSVWVIGAII